MYFSVIMPSAGHDLLHAEKKAAIESTAAVCGLAVRFPPASPYKSFDLDAALNELRNAGFVLADLTGERPSCYYELGLAEAMGKKVFLLAVKGTPIHQAASRRSTTFFTDMKEFRALIRAIFSEGQGMPIRSGTRSATG